MKRFNCGLFGFIVGGMLLLGADARAVTVQYFTVGQFIGGTGNNENPTGDTFSTAGGAVVIQYTSNQTTSYELDINEPSFADFGSFVVLESLDTSTPVSADFELQIVQAEPTFGTIDYTATLQGTLRIGQSGAFVEFDGPLFQSIGLVNYEIIENDQGVPGRAALVPATIEFGVLTPGTTSIEAQIVVIPEPSTMALLGMGAMTPLALMLRRRRHPEARA